jgi:ABC-type transport system involved in multi-copper enzyme maturation permease subunit
VLLLVLALVAAPSLAADRRAGALQFYLSKPITRRGYAVGKLLPPFLISWLLTGGVGLIVWTLGVAFTPEANYPDFVWRLPFAIVLSGATVSAVATMVAVAISGVMQNARLAAALWVALGIVSTALAGFLSGVTGRADVQVIGFFNVLDRVTRWLLATTGSNAPVEASVLIALGWFGFGALTLWLVLRDPEVAA